MKIIQAFADAHGLTKLGTAAENMILEKFMDVIEYEEFLTMPRDMLIEVIKQDSLEVNNELMVYRIGRVKKTSRHDAKIVKLIFVTFCKLTLKFNHSQNCIIIPL